MLYIKRLAVELWNRTIIKGLDLNISRGEPAPLLGPNGSGKSTLLHTIVGDPRYRVASGSVLFKGRELTGLKMEERVELGLGLSFQFSPG